MAARQALFRRAPQRPELDRLLEAARNSKISEEEFAEQRVSFAYGNASESSRSTKESVRMAAKRNLISGD